MLLPDLNQKRMFFIPLGTPIPNKDSLAISVLRDIGASSEVAANTRLFHPCNRSFWTVGLLFRHLLT